MTTPAKFLAKPDTDLSEIEGDDLKKLASGVVKRTLKLMLEASEEASPAWGEPLLAFLRTAAAIGQRDAHLAGAMVGLVDKNGPTGSVGALIDQAQAHREDEFVGAFLKLLKGELLSEDADRATAFKAKAEELEAALG